MLPTQVASAIAQAFLATETHCTSLYCMTLYRSVLQDAVIIG